MKTRLREVGAVRWALLTLSLVLMAARGVSAQQTALVGDVLIKLKPQASISQLLRDTRASMSSQLDTSVYGMRAPAGKTSAQFAAELSRSNAVLNVEINVTVSLPEGPDSQQHPFEFDGGTGDYVNWNVFSMIDLVNAWNKTTGVGVRVAVLDTGVSSAHPFLAGHLVSGYNCLSPQADPEDVPDNGTSNAAVGHGTMVAGIVAQVAPGADIMPIKVLNGSGAGTLADVLQGIRYAVRNRARIINMSFSSPVHSALLDEAIANAQARGVLVVAAAGNSGASAEQWPAACRNVLAVGSVEEDYTKSAFSTYGSFLSLVAPGSGILTTYGEDGLASGNGTSFACAFVTGEAALIRARHPHWRARRVRNTILRTAWSVDDWNPAFAGSLGRGMIDVDAAVSYGDDSDDDNSDDD